MDTKKATPTGSSPKKKTPKYIIALQHLLERADAGMNELEALRLYGETCLHSTISTLSNGHGIPFTRVFERHCHRRGGITHFKRYRIADRKKALKLVGQHVVIPDQEAA